MNTSSGAINTHSFANNNTHRRTTMKAIRENGLWVITAIVGGSVEEFAGKRLSDAIALLKRAQERAA